MKTARHEWVARLGVRGVSVRHGSVLIALTALTALLGVVVLVNDFGFLTPDTKPELYLQPAQTAARFASSWLDTPNLGAPNYNVGYVPVAAVLSLLEAVGVPAWLIMRLVRFGLLVLAAWGARLVLREVMGPQADSRAGSVGSIAVAVAYAANPYLVVGGGTLPTVLPYALLPWLVVCWFRGFRAPSWLWAVLAALVLTAMSGINAGVVPVMQLIVVVPVVLHACVVEGRRLGSVGWLVVRTGLVYLVLSAYWLVPALTALSVATSIAGATESVEAINTANSFPEVLRGLGMWTLYGADGDGWFDPGRVSMVLSPVVVLLSFGGPVAAALGVRLSDSGARLFGSVSVLVGALVMVGTHPVEHSTPWGRALVGVIENVPGLIAFRTTNKAGAVLELGMAVLIGLAAMAIAVRLHQLWQRAVALAAAAAVVAGSVFPALTGDLYWIPMDMPEYWNEASELVNARGADSRVLMVPGTGLPSYSWGYSGPDEIGPSLFRRPFVFRTAWPSGGTYAANLLYGVDTRLHQGTLPSGTVSALAAYIGAGDVVGRYDVRGTGNIGERVEASLDQDPGLGPVTSFGPAEVAHGAPGPATVRPVAGPVPATSATARPTRGALVVDGAGAALPDLQAAGLLEGRPAILLAGALSTKQLSESIRDEGRLVLTDSNARREASNTNPALGGPLLPASEEPDSTRALFDTSDQTVAVMRGNARVTATGRGLLFGPHASGDVSQAFDGDRTTAWQFGNFGSGVGNGVRIRMDAPLEVPTISLSPMQGGVNRITTARVTMTVGGQVVTKDVTFNRWNTFPTSVEVGPGGLSSVTLEVTGVAGAAVGPVGFSEISIPGLRLRKVGVLPRSLVNRLDEAAEAVGVDPATVPLDVVLRRSSGSSNGLATEEHRLEREFTLSQPRELTISGSVRLAGGVPDSRIDAVAGVRGDVTAESSSRIFTSSDARASKAFDDTGGEPDRSTAWVPNEPVVGEWITLGFPSRRLRSFTVTQADAGPHASEAAVSVNEGEPFVVGLGPGATRVELPEAVDATRVRILITRREGAGFVRFEDISLPRVPRPSVTPERCIAVGTIDGQPLMADLGGAMPELLDGGAVPFRACEATTSMAAGRHDVGSVPDFAVDDLHLATTLDTTSASSPPRVEVLESSASAMSVRVEGSCSPCIVSSGQSHDSRWQADLSGKDLGEPLVVDGYAAGWRVSAAPGDVIHIRYGPAGYSLAGWLASAAAMIVCLGLLALNAWAAPTGRRPSRSARPEQGRTT